MNIRGKIKVANVVWSLALSGFFIGAFLFLLHSGYAVQAQHPLEANIPMEVSSEFATSIPDPAVVDAILYSKSANLAEIVTGRSVAAQAMSMGQFSGHIADVLSPSSPPIPGGESLVVSMDSDRVWGITGAGETVTVTVDGVQMGAALADNNGFFWTTLYNGSGHKPDLDGGETIAIYHDGSLLASTTLRAVTASIDVVADDVMGSISGASSMELTVYAGWDEPNLTTYSQTVTTDGSGNYTVDFSGNWDFIADDRAQVVYTENTIEVHQRAYAPRISVLNFPHNLVAGNGIPGAAITMTLYESDGVTVKQQEFGTAAPEEGGAYNFTDVLMEDGDIVVVEIEGGNVLSRTVDALELYLDAENDRITGVAEPNAEIACRTQPLTEYGQALLSVETTADATGMYTVELAGTSDIMPGYFNGCYVHDTEGDDLVMWAPAYGLVAVDQTWDEVYGRAVAPAGSLAIGRRVTLTLYSHASDVTTSFSKGMDWGGGYSFNVDEDGLPDIQPGDTVTVESEGYSWQGVVDVSEISVQYDIENDRFTGEVNSPSDRVELNGQYWNPLSSRNLFPVGGSFDTGVTANSPFTAETNGFDVRNGVEFAVEHRTADELINKFSAKTDNVQIWTQYNALRATFPPGGTAYTITLRNGSGSHKAELTGASRDPDGHTGDMGFWDQGEQMEPGDYLEIRAANGMSQTLHIPDTISGGFDADADEISGNGPANRLLFMEVDQQGRGFVPTDGNGDFLIKVGQLQQLDGDGDFHEGQNVMICYLVLEGSQICYSLGWPAIYIDVNYAHQWVEVQTVPNETVFITITDNTGDIKGTLYGDSDGGGSFRSYEWDSWDPEQPTIQPGDGVTVTAADLEGIVIPIGQIDGDLDVDIDVVTGTLNASWFAPLTLTVGCEVWVENGIGFEIEGVEADGGEFVCDFGAEGWDLLPEHDVALRYREPDGDSIINVLRDPWMRVNYGHDWAGGDYPAASSE